MGKLLRKNKTTTLLLITVILGAVVFFAVIFQTPESVQAEGHVYYMAINGLDNNSGLIDSPWKTIAHAIDMMSAGDTLLIRGGIYYKHATTWFAGKRVAGYIYTESSNPVIDSFNSIPNGTENNPITIKAYPGETSIFDGQWIENNFIKLKGVDYAIIEGLTIRNYAASVIWTGYNDINYNNATPDCMDYAEHNIIKNCHIHNIGIDSKNHCIYVSWGNKYLEIYNNIFHDAKGAGIHGFHLPGVNNIRIFNNIMYNNGYGVIVTSGAENVYVYHNTFYNNSINVDFYHSGYGCGESGDWPTCNCLDITDYERYAKNIWVVNNISYSTGGFGLWVNENIFAEMHEDNNLWHDSTDNTPILWGNYNWTVQQLKDNTTNADNSIQAEPLFKNLENRDFHLQSTSPAIDKGINVGITTDFDNNPRPVDGDNNGAAEYDIGAYEYQAPQTSCLFPDLDCSGSVKLSDFILFKSHFNTQNIFSDFNNDHKTNIPDLGIMMGVWGSY